AATRVGSASVPFGDAEAGGGGAGRSELATAAGVGKVTATDGEGEPWGAGEGKAVGPHASARTAAMTRAARTDSMVSTCGRVRVRNSAPKYYADYRSADFSRPAWR